MGTDSLPLAMVRLRRAVFSVWVWVNALVVLGMCRLTLVIAALRPIKVARVKFLAVAPIRTPMLFRC